MFLSPTFFLQKQVSPSVGLRSSSTLFCTKFVLYQRQKKQMGLARNTNFGQQHQPSLFFASFSASSFFSFGIKIYPSISRSVSHANNPMLLPQCHLFIQAFKSKEERFLDRPLNEKEKWSKRDREEKCLLYSSLIDPSYYMNIKQRKSLEVEVGRYSFFDALIYIPFRLRERPNIKSGRRK